MGFNSGFKGLKGFLYQNICIGMLRQSAFMAVQAQCRTSTG